MLDPVSPPDDLKPRILAIDDDQLILGAVRRTLRRHADVTAVSDTRAARDLLNAGQTFDVVLCDIRMPGGSGIVFFRWLEINHPHMLKRLGFVSGAAVEPRYQAFFDHEGRNVLCKPFKPAQLVEFVGRLREYSAANESNEPAEDG